MITNLEISLIFKYLCVEVHTITLCSINMEIPLCFILSPIELLLNKKIINKITQKEFLVYQIVSIIVNV